MANKQSNMECKIAKMSMDLLHEDAPIYKCFMDSKDIWVENLKKDKNFYIEIRKDDIIDVYYCGGRVAQITLKDTELTATAHPKYIVDNPQKTDKRYFKQNSKYEPIYSDCRKCLATEEEIKKLKKRIEKEYSNSDGEKTSEKYIQAKLILDNDEYIDSEFAYRYYEKVKGSKDRKTVRFDLVKVVDNKIIVEELKRINDNRLLNKENDEPEIITQMTEYSAFMKENATELTEYYKELYKIKKSIGLRVPLGVNIDTLELSLTPKLIIKDLYEKETKGRKNRIAEIERVLKANQINYEFV